MGASVAPDVEPAAAGLVIGETVGRYRVRRLLGRGGMGSVYLARDIVLGRSIALKIVVGSESSRSFLEEARTIARLNHPHIVQLYDFGEHKSDAFLALEYVDGITLRERARDGVLELDEILRHLRAIADALTHAHASGVIHCDLKPGNVMIGRDGRVCVVDFGLAHTTETSRRIVAGTPDWMAPEQWANQELTSQVDSWALGVMAAQLLTGKHPLGDTADARRRAACDPDRPAAFRCTRDDVPPAIVELITRSLERNPELRPKAAEWRRTFDDAIAGFGSALAEDGPYPGLASFDEQRARFFFGRERELDEFLERLRTTPCLPIVGPSGAGKSSFMHAGVIPRLQVREPWLVISFRPGNDPIDALARQVLHATEPGLRADDPTIKSRTLALRAELVDTPTLLAARLMSLSRARDVRVLVAVDQLEEAFTHAAAGEARRLMQILLAAADDAGDPVRVVFTVRDDFLGRVAGIRSLFVMQKLDPNALRRAVTSPLERSDYTFDDPTIVDDLIAEVGSTVVADLPLLQFACRTLWDGRDRERRQLRRATYVDMGGIAGALARHAERALAEMTAEGRQLARKLLLQLVSGTARRTVARDQLIAMVGPAAAPVLDQLIATRLLVQRRADDSDDASVEIAHDSLIQTWTQLARWLDESRDERRVLEELDVAASLWERRGSRVEETWSWTELVAVRHRTSHLGLTLPRRLDTFLVAGEQRHRRAQRSRRLRLGGAMTFGVLVIAGLVMMGTRYLAREQLIATNAGNVELVFRPYDWVDNEMKSVDVSLLPDLRWKLYAADPDDPDQPGRPLPDNVVDVLDEQRAGTAVTWTVRAPGGVVFVEITGRGVAGEHCPASWIRIRAFPGYAGASSGPMVLNVPTCQATNADMVAIEAGPFIYGGPGEGSSSHFGDPDYTQPERQETTPAFSIDRTEVSNGAFTPFSSLEKITGYTAPIYTDETKHEHDREARYPVAEINAYEARAYCRYLGKELPSEFQWVKAARGGLVVHGVPNPSPRRLYPWGNEPAPMCANQGGEADGYPWVAPVDAMPCGASPYGVLNLAGNVQEWIDRAGQTDHEPLYVMRGGAADSPVDLEMTSTIYRNHRDPRGIEYSIGVRCVSRTKDAP